MDTLSFQKRYLAIPCESHQIRAIHIDDVVLTENEVGLDTAASVWTAVLDWTQDVYDLKFSNTK